MDDRPIRVAVVDDHPIVRAGIRAALVPAADLEIVADGASGDGALHLVDESRPDVLILDVDLPGINGLRRSHPRPPTKKPLRVAAASGRLCDLLGVGDSYLPGAGDGAQLLHHAHLIHLAPMFHSLAPLKADDIDHPDGDALAGGRNAHELALVGAAPGHANDDLVAFGEKVVNGGSEVREGAAEHGAQLLDPLTSTRNAGWQCFVLYEVGCKELVGPTKVTSIEEFLDHFAGYSLIAFSRHRLFSFI
jgi:Response regulator receiver domain